MAEKIASKKKWLINDDTLPSINEKFFRWVLPVVLLIFSGVSNAQNSFVPVVLRTTNLVVNINRTTGLPAGYLYKATKIHAGKPEARINAIVCRLHPRSYTTVQLSASKIVSSHNEADVFFEAQYDNKTACTFHIKYKLDSTSLVITMAQVKEVENYELIEAALPELATVREEDGESWLAHGLEGGGVVNLKNARNYQLPDDDYFGNIGYVLPVAVLGTKNVLCTMEVSAYMDGTKIAVTGAKGFHHASMGTVEVYRVHGGRGYNMNNGGPLVQGNEETPNLLVGQPSRCRLDFAGDFDADGNTTWVDGAKLIARRMPPIPTSYFNDKFIYLIGGKYKPEKFPRTTFLQSEKLVRDISMLTDNASQVPLISGWVYDGQDTGFPSEDSVNESLGGYNGLMHLFSQGPAYNANISVNTNYDDAYKSSPEFDTAFIARQPDGNIWKSRDWAGEYSYITGMAKYIKNYGIKRINYSVDRYHLHDAILVDAMSWHGIRNDWDKLYPASGYTNLVDGKFRIIEEFGKRGIHVMSEQLRYPFIGKLAVTADGTGGGVCPFGGDPVPFLAAVYRKSAIWGTGNFSRNDAQKSLFWNCRSIQWYTDTSDRKSITDFFYLTVLPFNKVHDLDFISYTKNDFHSLIGLSDQSSVESDGKNGNYTVKWRGKIIAQNNSTFCPLDSNRIACYSRNGGEQSIELPEDWNPPEIAILALYVDHREPFQFHTADKKIIIQVPAATPIIIYRNSTIAGK
ncbi:MAG: endo-alpha-N-acetylgalactosaminidase family protein [Bacteroidota bacterium]|nr:endo-alpha-N-acetylgalactosaminidase family protein [Bacteroidota bacterium]